MTVGIEVEGLRELQARVRRLPKVAQAELREASQAIADMEAPRLRGAASASSRQAGAIASSIRVRRDRFPAIAAGGRGRTGVSGGATAGQLFYGAEFGGRSSRTTMQFRPHLGQRGYFFFPTLRADQPKQRDLWEAALRNLEREWGVI